MQLFKFTRVRSQVPLQERWPVEALAADLARETPLKFESANDTGLPRASASAQV